ncbi:MAG: hypothetical protein L0215_20240 [Gemmataceae bacterium]|nr:hypothetical protein [Gemmataceae bacterium]
MPRNTDDDLDLDAHERKALGVFESVHAAAASRMHKWNIAIASIFSVLLLVPGLWLLVWGLFVKRGAGIEYAGLAFGGLGIPCVIGVLFLVRRLKWKLYLFDNGFVWDRGKLRLILWKDVKYLSESKHLLGGRAADYQLRFVTNDEARFTIDSSYRDFEQFADAVRVGVTLTVFERAKKAFASGESIPFGKLHMSKEGFEKDGETLAWKDIARMGVEGTELFAVSIYRREKGKTEPTRWYFKDVPDFANFDAFLKLAAKFTKVTMPGAD